MNTMNEKLADSAPRSVAPQVEGDPRSTTRDMARQVDKITSDDALLDTLQRHSFEYFRHETNPKNGLVRDRSQPESPASIAAVGFALASYPVGVERGWMTRAEAKERTLAVLRFFWNSAQGKTADATGYKGFYYHFLDMETGQRDGDCELSTIDTTFLLAGMLATAAYFEGEGEDEREIRTLADALYCRADWQWAQNGGATVTHGWKPEGFLQFRWEGYDEALLLYMMGLGSPTFPLLPASYAAWASTYQWKEIYDREYLYGGPLFIHQYSHLWLDFRGIQDDFMRSKNSDYFENSRRAAYIHQQYAVNNPLGFAGYGAHFWGLTASDGPGPATREIDGIERIFFDYVARGVPYGPDDGTVAPWAAVASLPFAPEIVLPTIRHFMEVYPQVTGKYCLKCSFNLTFTPESPQSRDKVGWTSQHHYGINLGPVVLACENHRTGLPWRLMRSCPAIVAGLRRAGFAGGWL